MQQHKSTNKFSEIEVFAKDSETLTSTLSEAMGKFQLKKITLKIFRFNYQITTGDSRRRTIYFHLRVLMAFTQPPLTAKEIRIKTY